MIEQSGVRSGTGRLVLATGNPHKVIELRQILADVVAASPQSDRPQMDLEAAIVGLDAFTNVPEVVENGTTFAANALLKARAVCAATGLPALADDSGLAVDVLGGAPGIFSARWAGRRGEDRATQDQANVALLLAQLSDVVDEHRGAGFVCAAALVTPDGDEHVAHGEVRGVLGRSPYGDHGFGYDPLLRLPDGRTLAQYTPQEKNAISHRGLALRAIAPCVLAVISANAN